MCTINTTNSLITSITQQDQSENSNTTTTTTMTQLLNHASNAGQWMTTFGQNIADLVGNIIQRKVPSEIETLDSKSAPIKSETTNSHFGLSLYHLQEELLAETTISMNMPSFSETKLHESLEAIIALQADKVDPRLHAQCSRLFIELIQQSVQENRKGHYHIEHSLLLLAERLMAGYYSQIMNPDITKDSLHKEIKIIYHSISQERFHFLNLGDSLYLTLGALDCSAMNAEQIALRHIELAQKYGLVSNDPAISVVMKTIHPKSIKEVLNFLQTLPKTTEIARICVELTSALHLQALSTLRLDNKHLDTPWIKNLLLRILKSHIKDARKQAIYHHERASQHQINLQLKIANLEGLVENHKTAMQLLSQAQTSGILSKTTLAHADQNLQELNRDLQNAKEQLNAFQARLKKQNIDAIVLDHAFSNNLSEQLVYCMNQLDDEALPLPSNTLDLKTAIFKALHHFLNQYAADLKEVLPDPRANLFD